MDRLDIHHWPDAGSSEHIGDFIEEMKKEYMRHIPKKGDSWKTCDLKWLTDLFQRTSLAVMDDADDGKFSNPGELIDVANICAMIWLRTSQNTYEKRLEK